MQQPWAGCQTGLPGSRPLWTDSENRVVLFTLSGAYLVQSTKPFRHRRTSLDHLWARTWPERFAEFVNDV